MSEVSYHKCSLWITIGNECQTKLVASVTK